jgi:hypothetical protein
MQARDRLDEAFTWRAERTLSQSLTLQYDNILFMIEPSEFAQAAIGQRVEVVDFPNGRLEVRYKGRSMSNGAQKGPPMGAEKGPLFHGLRAARRVALS